MRVIPVRRWLTTTGALILAAMVVVAPASPAQAAVACEVDYTATTWAGGTFLGNAQLRNLGDTTWNGITVEFTFAGGQQLTTVWNYTVTVSGQNVQARSSAWAPPVPPGGTTLFSFIGSYTGVNTPPTNWRVNGAACTVAGQPPAVIAEPATRTVPEGSSASFTVRLSHPPAEAVTLRMTGTGTGVWAMPPMLIIFSPTDWSTPKMYTVYSSPDSNTVDDIVVFTLSVPGYAPDTVTFTQIDAG